MADEKETKDNTILFEMNDRTEDVEKDACLDEDITVTMVTEDPQDEKIELTYRLTDVPSWIACIFLGLQQFLTMFSAQVTFAVIIADLVCMPSEDIARSQLLSSLLFVCGLNTLLQCTLGTRLPIIQGSSGAFLTVIVSILSMPQWQCPREEAQHEHGVFLNESLKQMDKIYNTSTTEENITWEHRIRNIQGAVLVGGLFEMIIGISGILGPIMRRTGPLVVCVVISLIGIPLFSTAAELCASCWPISLLVVALIILFSQYIGHLQVPILTYSKGVGCHRSRFPVLLSLSILVSMVIVWLFCVILTSAGVLSSNNNGFGYFARTDTKITVIYEAPWARMPYPGQWGVPTFSLSAILGVFAANIATTIESVGDYHACARLIDEPSPPPHVINRGIAAEGLGCFLCGIFGVGAGTTSYTINLGLIVVSKVASRRVIQFAGLWMIILGIFSKFGAIFTTLPQPIVGGMFLFIIGYVLSAGLANLQFVNLNASRNLFIIGFSFCVGIGVPAWINNHPDAIQTGSVTGDQMVTVLLRSHMLLGGLSAFIFDNTLSGSSFKVEDKNVKANNLKPENRERLKVYDLPFIMKFIRKVHILKYVPISPTYK